MICPFLNLSPTYFENVIAIAAGERGFVAGGNWEMFGDELKFHEAGPGFAAAHSEAHFVGAFVVIAGVDNDEAAG